VERSGEKTYSEYLQRRSLKGYMYRKWLLYPRLVRGLEGKILDFGCGIGDFLACCKNSIGVDINQHCVAACVQRGLDARHIKSGRLPFPDGYFASAVMDNVIEHIPCEDAEDVIEELLRVLAPGGILLIGIPGAKGYASDEDHKCFYTENDLTGLMETLSCIRMRTRHLPFYFPVMGNFLRQYCTYVYFRTPVNELKGEWHVESG